jgi:hypothetical protein
MSRAEHPVAVRQQLRPERFDQAIEAFYLRRHARALAPLASPRSPPMRVTFVQWGLLMVTTIPPMVSLF